jgi:hypothetical protein
MPSERYSVHLDSPWDTDEVIERLKKQVESEEELDAHREAMRLASYLGEGWLPSVSQAYGITPKWRWGAYRGGIMVRPDLLRPLKHDLEKIAAPFGYYFGVMIGDPKMVGTGFVWHAQIMPVVISPTHWDPKEAVRLARQHCLAGIQDRIDALHRAQTYIGEWEEDSASVLAPLPPPSIDMTKVEIP